MMAPSPLSDLGAAVASLPARAALLLCGLLAACGGAHDDLAVEVTATECATCHISDYQSVQDPNHIAMGFAQTCVYCHVDEFWRPALGELAPHPNDQFSITNGPHKEFDCVDCHDPTRGSSLMGANTDCIGCHSGTHARDRMDRKHREVEDYAATDDGTTNFCLECHPDGRTE